MKVFFPFRQRHFDLSGWWFSEKKVSEMGCTVKKVVWDKLNCFSYHQQNHFFRNDEPLSPWAFLKKTRVLMKLYNLKRQLSDPLCLLIGECYFT